MRYEDLTDEQLRRAVAERLGWTEVASANFGNVIGYKPGSRGYPFDHKESAPKFSTSIADAWGLVEQIKEKCSSLDIGVYPNMVRVDLNEFCDSWIIVEATNAPRAICVAYLKFRDAVRGDGEEGTCKATETPKNEESTNA